MVASLGKRGGVETNAFWCFFSFRTDKTTFTVNTNAVRFVDRASEVHGRVAMDGMEVDAAPKLIRPYRLRVLQSGEIRDDWRHACNGRRGGSVLPRG